MSPYKLKSRTIIVGGHDSWLRELRPRLKGRVSYIGREQASIDDASIAKADVIWIQPNALSHGVLWRVSQKAKAAGVSINYFGYAGVRNCLNQIIESDKLM